MQCTVCGGTGFTFHEVLWEQLISDWQLSPDEAAYVNRQQGETCDQCGANLRSIALANAIRSFLQTKDFLRDSVATIDARVAALLEINEAGTLTPVLGKASGYRYAAYPAVDMHRMPYPDASFDLVVHSDTLEHLADPVHGLVECRRILKPGGALCFTVPIVVGRMSRSRHGLPRSFHGNEEISPDDFVVHTEFGADAWTYAMRAGFSQVELHAIGYPAGIAMLARA